MKRLLSALEPRAGRLILNLVSLVSAGSVMTLAACQSAPVTSRPQSETPAAQASAPSASAKPGAAQAAVKGKTLLAIYMVGSDLEDDVKPRNGISDEVDKGGISTRGSGTSDLLELIEGWKLLSSAQQASLDVMVAFGGARKQGWQGVKYADVPCLILDSEDNYFGNAKCYQRSEAGANLSTEQSLLSFLKNVKDKAQGHDRVMLDLWDHGAAFLGMGHDTNHPDVPLISLPILKQAFSASGLHVDLLGFDACLMASLEVAGALQPYADYLLASQELEPGHGWHYGDIVKTLTTTTDMPAIGRQLVDSFITHENHQRTRNKTLSLTDLRQVPPLLAALDQFIAKLPAQTPVPVLPSLQATPEFGVQSRGGVAYTIDLPEFVNNVLRHQPELASEAEALTARIKQAIVYHREDDSKPLAGGITIYSLNRELKPDYTEDQSVSRAFLSFVEQWLAAQTAPGEAPLISAEGFATAQQQTGLQVSVPECRASDGRAGQCLQVQAPRGALLERLLALETPDGLQILGRERLQPLNLQATRYFSPRWDGNWLRLCDGNCLTGARQTPPAIFSHTARNGHRIYVAEAELNGRAADWYIELDPNAGRVTHHWLVPHAETRGRVPVPSRLSLEAEAGDSVRFASYTLKGDGTLTRSLGPVLTLSAAPVWDYVPLPPELGRPVYLTRASSAASQQASFSAPVQAAAETAPLQNVPAPAAPGKAVSFSLAPTRVNLSGLGDTFKPLVYLKDQAGQDLKLPLVWQSLSSGLEVSADGLITVSRADFSFGTIKATEPVSGLSAQIDVAIMRGGGTSSVQALSPLLSSLSPSSGRTATATAITLSGSNFAAGSTVTIGNVPATGVTVVSPTTITATVPAGLAPNVYNVTLTVPGYDPRILPLAFTIKGPFDVAWVAAPVTGVTVPMNEVNSIVIDPGNPNIRYFTGFFNSSLYKSSDGGTSWTQSITGLPAGSNLSPLTLDPFNSSRLFIGENSRTIFRSTDSALNWTEQPTGLANSFQNTTRIVMDPVTPNTLYATLSNYDVNGFVFKSTDGGSTWASLNGDIPAPNTQVAYDLAVDPTNNQILYLARGGGVDVMKSVNGGVNWTAANTGLPNSGGILGAKKLLLNPQNPNRLYALANQGFFTSGLYRSSDGGATWTALTNGLPPNNPGVVTLTAIAMDANNPNTLYAGTQGAGMYKSIDGGDNWQAINLGLPISGTSDINTITVHPQNPDLVYVGLMGPSTTPIYQTVP